MLAWTPIPRSDARNVMPVSASFTIICIVLNKFHGSYIFRSTLKSAGARFNCRAVSDLRILINVSIRLFPPSSLTEKRISSRILCISDLKTSLLDLSSPVRGSTSVSSKNLALMSRKSLPRTVQRLAAGFSEIFLSDPMNADIYFWRTSSLTYPFPSMFKPDFSFPYLSYHLLVICK